MVYKETRDGEAPFNMAIATLMRLDSILKQIRGVASNYVQDSFEKQKIYLDLVKQFFINSIPLLDEEDVKDNKDKILNLKIKTKKEVKSGSQRVVYSYDKDLEKQLNDILIDLQTKLKKYFMPKSKDPGSAIQF